MQVQKQVMVTVRVWMRESGVDAGAAGIVEGHKGEYGRSINYAC